MEITIAKTAGYCYGVSRCIDITNNELTKGNLYTFGNIIHNKNVVNNLKQKGASVINSVDDMDVDNQTVIVRSHGLPRNTIEELCNRNANIIDATCPFVKKIHDIVSEESNNGKKILVVGNINHPEVIGIVGWINGDYEVITEFKPDSKLKFDIDDEIVVVVQTTFNKNKFAEIVENIVKKGYHINVCDTICLASKNRQEEADFISKNVDIMLVIGDKLSSNTRKLFEICSTNCINTYLVEDCRDIDKTWFDNTNKVGITAGASTPSYIIEEVQNYVRNEL